MITQKTKIALLVLILFLSNYSQEQHKIYTRINKEGCTITSTTEDDGGLGDMTCPVKYKSKGSPLPNKYSVVFNATGDTLWLPPNSDRVYAIFSGTPLEVSHSWWKFKINSVIRGDFDTTSYSTTIGLFESKNCPTKIEANKSYLVLNFLLYKKEVFLTPGTKCKNILPDTPENREILIKRYEKIIIIKEPKPSEAKKK